jgi:hypothetical protein
MSIFSYVLLTMGVYGSITEWSTTDGDTPMGYEAEQALIKATEEMRAADHLFDEKAAYWNAMLDKFNTTGLSLMQLNETPEGKIKADDICQKIGAAMVAKFGEE